MSDRTAPLGDGNAALGTSRPRPPISLVNLSILKTGKARAVRFSTLTRICHALDCQPGDILVVER